MSKINLRESLIQLDIDSDFKYSLTELYEACRLDEKEKNKLVKMISAPNPNLAVVNNMLASNAGMSESLPSDDLSDEELPEGIEIEGLEHTLTSCPVCGDISFDSRKGCCEGCSYREAYNPYEWDEEEHRKEILKDMADDALHTGYFWDLWDRQRLHGYYGMEKERKYTIPVVTRLDSNDDRFVKYRVEDEKSGGFIEVGFKVVPDTLTGPIKMKFAINGPKGMTTHTAQTASEIREIVTDALKDAQMSTYDLEVESLQESGTSHPDSAKITDALMKVDGTTKVEFDWRPDDGLYKNPENHIIILVFSDERPSGWKQGVMKALYDLGWKKEDPIEDNDSYLYLVMQKSKSTTESFKPGDCVWVKPAKKSGRVAKVKGDYVTVEVMGGKDPDRRDVYYSSDLELQDCLEERWTDAYEKFNEIVNDMYMESSEEEIAAAVEKLYRQHEGEADWDDAWLRWLEPSSDPEEPGYWEKAKRWQSEMKRVNGNPSYTKSKTKNESLFDAPRYKEDEWEPEDIELHKNTDWAARNYMELPVPEDNFEHEVVAYGLPGGTQRKNVKFIKYIRPNEIFPPYYAPEENAFENTVGVMYDGAGKHGKYNIHNRYETQDVYDALSEGAEVTDEPYSFKEVENDLKRLTNNFTVKSDTLKCGYKEEKDHAIQILKKHYNVVDVAGDEVDGTQWYFISFDEPKKAIKESFEFIDSKSIKDFDGFMTEYSMYKDNDSGRFVFVYGDSDIYTPEDENFDWECDSEEEAREWFDNYNGFEDDVIDEDTDDVHLKLSGDMIEIPIEDDSEVGELGHPIQHGIGDPRRKRMNESADDVNSEVKEILSHGDEYAYRMLSRWKSDFKYLLGAVKDANDDRLTDAAIEHALWWKDISKQAKAMRGLFKGLKKKPEWITLDEIDEYESASKEKSGNGKKKVNESKSINEDSLVKERDALKENSKDFSIHRESELKKLGNGDADKFLRDTPHPLLHDILDYIYDKYDEHIGYGRHSEHSYRDGEYYIELATNENGHGASTDLIKRIDRDVRNVFGDKCITAVVPEYPSMTDHTCMVLYVNDIVADYWSSKYEGVRALFHAEDFDWDEDTDLMNELDGEVCTIKWLSIDNDNFKDSYWEIDFEDGTHFDAISGYALDVLDTPKNESKSLTESKGRFELEIWVPGSGGDDDRERFIMASNNLQEIIDKAHEIDLDSDEAFYLRDMKDIYPYDLDQCYDAEELEDAIHNEWHYTPAGDMRKTLGKMLLPQNEGIETSKEWEHKDKEGRRGRIRKVHKVDGAFHRKPLTREEAEEIMKFRGHEDDELYPVNESKDIDESSHKDFLIESPDYFTRLTARKVNKYLKPYLKKYGHVSVEDAARYGTTLNILRTLSDAEIQEILDIANQHNINIEIVGNRPGCMAGRKGCCTFKLLPDEDIDISQEPINEAIAYESKSINEDLSSITSLADDCGKNTFKKSARDVRFTFEDEKSASKFMNKLKEKNIQYGELPRGVIKVIKSSVLDESKSIKEAIELTADEMEAKHSADNSDIIDAGKSEEERASLKEAAPSKLTKSKDTSSKRTNSYYAGDIYDSHSGTYDKQDTYYGNTSEGYITDKSGNKYDVVTSITTEDSGRIAGGTTNYYVTIHYGDKKLGFSGYSAIFSSSQNTGMIDAIRDGIFLEDFCAKFSYSGPEKELVNELAAKGNKEASSYKVLQADKKQAKFEKRYINIPLKKDIKILISGGDLSFSEDNDTAIYPYLDKLNSLLDKVKDTLNKHVLVNGYTLQDLNNSIIYLKRPSSTTILYDSKNHVLMFDYSSISDKKSDLREIGVAFITEEKYDYQSWSKSHKYVSFGEPFYYKFNMYVINVKGSPLFKELSKIAAKVRRSSRAGWISTNVDYTLRDNAPYYGYARGEKGPATAKAKAKAQQIFDDVTNTILSGEVPTQFLVNCLNDLPKKEIIKISDEISKDVSAETSSTGERNKSYPSAYYDKMKAWHEGKRKQNVKACSDEKLLAYYDICKELGFEDECSILKSEIDARHIKIDE